MISLASVVEANFRLSEFNESIKAYIRDMPPFIELGKQFEAPHHPDIEQMLDDLKWDEMPPRVTIIRDMQFKCVTIMDPYQIGN